MFHFASLQVKDRWPDLALGLKNNSYAFYMCNFFLLILKGEQKLYMHSPYFLCGRHGVQFTRGGCEAISSLELVSIFQIKTLYKNAKEKDTLHLCNLLIILQCLICTESSNSRRARKNCSSTRFTVNKGEKRKTDLFSQQYEFKELYGVCILQEARVGRKMKHCTLYTAIKMRGFIVVRKFTAGRQYQWGNKICGPSSSLPFRVIVFKKKVSFLY